MNKKFAPFYWLIGWVGLFFLVPELAGVFNDQPGDTFSEAWWGLFQTNDPTAPTWIKWGGSAFAVIFGGWLIGHLGFGLWGGPRKIDWSIFMKIYEQIDRNPEKAKQMVLNRASTKQLTFKDESLEEDPIVTRPDWKPPGREIR